MKNDLQNTKLSELIIGLSAKEKNELIKFVSSPYFNNSSRLVLLLRYIKQNRYDFDSVNLTKVNIFSKLFPREKFNSKKLELLISNSVKKINTFVAVNYFLKDDNNLKLSLIRSLRKKKMNKNFSSLSKQLRVELTKKSTSKVEDYLLLSQTEHEIIVSDQYRFFFSKNVSYQKSIDNLDYYFALKKFRQAVLILNHKNEVGYDLKYKFRFLEEIIEFVKSNISEISKNHPVIYCYYLIILILNEPLKEDNYFELRNYFLANSSGIDEELLWDILIEMKNYADNMVKLKREKYIKEIFEIYSELEKKKYFAKPHFINHIDFLNSVTVGLLLKKYMWVQKFITAYKQKLHLDCRDITLNLVKAEILFHKKNYNSALLCLNNLYYDNYYFYLRIKVLTVKIYYELDETDLLIYTLDALKHYLKRHEKILGRYSDNTKNFANYVNYLLKFRYHPKNDLKQVINKVALQSDLTSKEWVMEKLSELSS